MISKTIGGILLIVGTSIGAGMLALPVANAATGFWPSSLFLLACWTLMTFGAFYLLEVNLYLPPGKNMISMAAATLGKPGLVISWVSYLLLLYSLLSAYISGGADVLGGLLQHLDIYVAPWKVIVLFTLAFGLVVYGGIRQVDLLNRFLMFAKLGIYLFLIFLITPFIKPVNFVGGDPKNIISTVMILITSFGYAIIIPNLRDYFNDDIPRLKKVIFIGSIIPLFCYFAWDAVIIGALPANSIAPLMQSSHTTSTLAQILSSTVNNSIISSLFNAFTSVCMLTAFLGVSLCLMSFLGDGLKMSVKGREGGFLFLLTFLPPLLLVLYFPGVYISALKYAGFCCVILLLLLPAAMSLFGRKKFFPAFLVPGTKFTQWLVIICSLLLLLVAI